MEVTDSVQQPSPPRSHFTKWKNAVSGKSRERSREIVLLSPQVPLALTGLVLFKHKIILNNQSPFFPRSAQGAGRAAGPGSVNRSPAQGPGPAH